MSLFLHIIMCSDFIFFKVWLFSPPWDIFSLAMSNCYIFDGEIIMHVKKNTAIVVLLHA